MTRNVRNFWIDLDVDGRSSRIGTGPVSKDGGIDLYVRMRDNGCITLPVTIHGSAREDGTLTLTINVEGRDEIIVINTQR